MLKGVTVKDATHVLIAITGRIEKIVQKEGSNKRGYVVTTERGQKVSMQQAKCYLKEG